MLDGGEAPQLLQGLAGAELLENGRPHRRGNLRTELGGVGRQLHVIQGFDGRTQKRG